MVESAEFTQVFQAEAQKTMNRVKNMVDAFVVNTADPVMAQTPKDVVWKRGKTRLYRYRRPDDSQSATRSGMPYIIVPWLGISRTNVLDMLPGNSYVEFMVNQGHDVYLLDWGEIAEEDKDLGFEDAVEKILPRAINRALELSDAREVTLNGICLGGTISSCYLALNPDAPVRNFVCMVAPIDFDHGGLFKAWLNGKYFPTDLMVQRYGGIPASLMGTAFKMLRPTQDAQAMSALWANMDKREYVTSYKAMNKWATDYIGMPGRFFSQLSKDLYANNRLVGKQFKVNGRRVDLGAIQQPVLVVSAGQDNIVPPLAAKGLMDLVSSPDREYLQLPGGHISVFSGRQANQNLWPKVADWLSTRCG